MKLLSFGWQNNGQNQEFHVFHVYFPSAQPSRNQSTRHCLPLSWGDPARWQIPCSSFRPVANVEMVHWGCPKMGGKFWKPYFKNKNQINWLWKIYRLWKPWKHLVQWFIMIYLKVLFSHSKLIAYQLVTGILYFHAHGWWPQQPKLVPQFVS